MHSYKSRTIKMASANTAGYPKRSHMGAQAQARIVMLALVSFLLGVAVTAVWFHAAPHRNQPVANSPSGAPPVQESATPAPEPKSPARAFVEQPIPVGPAAIEDVKRALPNYASVSVEEGTEILRQATLKKFAAAVNELQSQVTKAQEELKLAENKSPAEQQAAMKHLQQVQAEQSQKLQQIGGRLQAQIAALKQLKSTN